MLYKGTRRTDQFEQDGSAQLSVFGKEDQAYVELKPSSSITLRYLKLAKIIFG
jgi:hypothetical protein